MVSKVQADVAEKADGSPMDFTGQVASKSWAHVDQRVGNVLRDSFNVSSFTDEAVGRQAINLTNSMTDTLYGILGSNSLDSTVSSGVGGADEVWPVSVSQLRHETRYSTTIADMEFVYTAVLGDLA